jgi:ABC-type cobalamin/Fe3+-siderophores transport system ATPase subunit
VLHDLNQAAVIADHVILLSSGTVVESGTAEAVLTRANLAQVFGIDVAITRTEQGRRHLDVLGRKR